jgi:hypothetical protein
MALNEQEKQERLAKLKEHANWWSFTDSVRVFLAGMAEGLDFLQAAKRAYPDCKNHVVMTKSLLARVGIQSALESIGLDTNRANISKAEALKHLSRFMRNAKDATEYCKLLAQYSKLQGWSKDDDDPEDKPEVNLNDLVAAIEKKRKADTK